MKNIMLVQLLLGITLVLEPFVDAKGFVLDGEGAAIAKAKITYHRDLSGDLLAGVTEDH